jgi:hypothetical protein
MFDSRLSEFDCRRRQGKIQRPVKREEVNLKETLRKIELDESFLSTSAQLQEAGKLTPEYAALLMSAPILAMGYESRRRQQLSRRTFAIFELSGDENDIFFAYMDGWVFNELHNLLITRD